jgi:ElaB/YqjD/DUF883 family membrane-anchored ribosome-binding protein
MPTTANRRNRGGQQTRDWPSDMQQATSSMQQASSKSGEIAEDAIQYLRNYVHEKPESAALWALGIGFVLGWKLKPW